MSDLMVSARLLSVIVALGITAIVHGQTPSTPPVLSAATRAHLKAERLQAVTSVRGLPLGVRDALQQLFKSPTLEIAEPGSRFQATDDIATPRLPIRRLVAAGCSQDHCLVYYERGGIAHVWQAALFHWTPAETRFEGGGTAPRDLTSIDEVRDALLSGVIKGPNRYW